MILFAAAPRLNTMQPTNDTGETDSQLIRRALAGDRLARGRLTERHRRSILALAFRTLENADDAQDVAQEALVYALQRLPDLREAGRFASWLRNITLSLCADYRRRRGTRRLGEPLTVLNETSEEKHYAEALTVRQAVAGLSEAHRTTLLLHYVGGWSREEVASILEIPVNTVRSRLMAAKRNLRADLPGFFPEAPLLKGNPMSTNLLGLSETQKSLINAAFPGGGFVGSDGFDQAPPPGVHVHFVFVVPSIGKTVEFRDDITPEQAALVPVLEKLGMPGPRILGGPLADGAGRYQTLCETPRGESLTDWALGGTPHRIRLATERAFEGIDRLQGLTAALQADPVGANLERRTLSDEVLILTDDARWAANPWLAEEGRERSLWLADPWFQGALAKVREAVANINEPLVYTDYTHFYPQLYRIAPSSEPFDEPLGAPGDPAYQKNPLVEFTWGCKGHYGDPTLGLAMVWVQDCYPFVHTGFVEQFLWRRGVTQREFAPRLALKALQMIARDLPHARPAEGGGYWDGLHGWAEQGLGWL